MRVVSPASSVEDVVDGHSGEVVAGGPHGVEPDRVGRGHVDGVVQLPLVLVPN